MKNRVVVVPEDGMIAVDGDMLHFSFEVPQGLETLHALQWYGQDGHMEFTDDMNQEIQGQDLYNSEVLPFVKLWEAEKARLEAEANKPPTLKEVQEAKLQELATAFETVESEGYTVSLLGFRIDATKNSLTDVQGLILLVKNGQVQEPVLFRDYDNAFHPSTLADLQTMELEITGHGVTAYAQKWQLEAQILAEDATVESVQAVDVHAGLSGYDWPQDDAPEAPQG